MSLFVSLFTLFSFNGSGFRLDATLLDNRYREPVGTVATFEVGNRSRESVGNVVVSGEFLFGNGPREPVGLFEAVEANDRLREPVDCAVVVEVDNISQLPHLLLAVDPVYQLIAMMRMKLATDLEIQSVS
jgi:hypothetical protein